MLENISKKLTCIVLGSDNKDSNKFDVIVYGFMLIVSTLLCMISITVISLIMRDIFIGLVFMLVFMPLRTCCGGYHCSSYGRCFILTNALFVTVAVISNIMNMVAFSHNIAVLVLSISAIFILAKSPVECKENPKSKRQLEKNKKASIGITLTIYIVAVALIVVFRNNPYVMNYLCVVANTMLLVATLMIVLIIKNRGEVKFND